MFNNSLTDAELQDKMMQVLDDERKRISLDLHDNVQNKLRLLRDKYLNVHPDFANDVKILLEEVRYIAYQLIPKNLQEYSLSEYLNIYATTLRQTYARQFKVDFQTNVEIAVPKKVEVELFKIVQECFNNVLKYASNTPVFFIRYLQREDHLVLILQDMGDGFDLEAAREKGTIGLNSIETRAQLIGAQCELETRLNEGCKVKITLPMTHFKFAEHEIQTIPKAYDKKIVPRQKPLKMLEHILIVDNQREYGDYLQAEIKNQFPDATVKYRQSAKAAHEYLEKIDYQLDVIITDITMPQESGIRMIKNIRKKLLETGKTQSIEYIIYSINDNPAYVFQAKQLPEVRCYICKEELEEEEAAAKIEHPILTALKNWHQTDYKGDSPAIKKIAKSFERTDFDMDKDTQERKAFKKLMCLKKAETKPTETEIKAFQKKLDQLDKEDPKKKDTITKKFLQSLVSEELSVDIDVVDKYFRRYKSYLGIRDNHEMQHLLLRLSRDLGFLDEC